MKSHDGCAANADAPPNMAPSSSYKIGWVYILSHQHYGDKVKIGFTERTVEERIAELEAGTGAPRGIELSYAIATSNPRELEFMVHDRLASKRTWKDKEFFEISSLAAAVILKDIAKTENFKIFDELDPGQSIRAQREKEESERRRAFEMIERQKQLEHAEKEDAREKIRRSGLTKDQRYAEDVKKIRAEYQLRIASLDKAIKTEKLKYSGVIVGEMIDTASVAFCLKSLLNERRMVKSAYEGALKAVRDRVYSGTSDCVATCASCGARNRVPAGADITAGRCGKCRHSL